MATSEPKELDTQMGARRRRTGRQRSVLGSILIAGFLVVIVGGVLLSFASPATAAATWVVLVVGVVVTGSLVYGVFLRAERSAKTLSGKDCP